MARSFAACMDRLSGASTSRSMRGQKTSESADERTCQYGLSTWPRNTATYCLCIGQYGDAVTLYSTGRMWELAVVSTAVANSGRGAYRRSCNLRCYICDRTRKMAPCSVGSLGRKRVNAYAEYAHARLDQR